MKLCLVSQERNNGYDTYDSAVVAAETEDEAQKVRVGSVGVGATWVTPQDVRVKLIGEAIAGTEAGAIICASFNAG